MSGIPSNIDNVSLKKSIHEDLPSCQICGRKEIYYVGFERVYCIECFYRSYGEEIKVVK